MVRLDIVSGFLGAGKTTFIKKIMDVCLARKEKVALIENEYGQISIDTEILKKEGYKIYDLLHGCVCCTLKGEFTSIIKSIFTLKQKPDRIILEPSGIFIFDEIFDLFKDPQIAPYCSLNSVTTIVDGKNFFKHRNAYSCFFENQIFHASTLVISRAQFLDPQEINAIKSELLHMNNSALIMSKDWATYSPLDIMLAIDGNIKYAFSNSLVNQENKTKERLHHFGFESVGFRTSKIFEIKELEKKLEEISNCQFGNILRGKGILQCRNHSVEFSYVDGEYWIEKINSSTTGILSFIGTGLKRDKLKSAFEYDS